jgi:hypothetical protein
VTGSSGGKKEPEDIFAGIDKGNEQAITTAPVFDEQRKSPVKLILFAVAVVLVVGAIGFGVWYFLIRPKSQSLPTASETTTTPKVIPAEPAPIVEVPPALPPKEESALPPELPAPESITPSVVVEPTEATDTDADGLSDAEESLLGTSTIEVDSDGDGFADGSEVQSGYDPVAVGKKLSESVSLKKENIGATLSALMPFAWTVSAGSEAGSYAVETGTLATVEVKISQKTSGSQFTDWLVENGIDAAAGRSFTTRAGNSAWQSADRLTTYVLQNDTVVKFQYLLNGSTSYEFRNIYDMMMQSLMKV